MHTGMLASDSSWTSQYQYCVRTVSPFRTVFIRQGFRKNGAHPYPTAHFWDLASRTLLGPVRWLLDVDNHIRTVLLASGWHTRSQ